MVLMEAPRTRGMPHEPTRDPGRAEMEALYWSLDSRPELEGYRVEFLDGRIIVSPQPVIWHGRAAMWLFKQFEEACDANGWEWCPGGELVVPSPVDVCVPDGIIVSDPDALSDLNNVIPAKVTLLVAEVASPSSVRDDRETKRRIYARAGVPFYLLVDRFVATATITLFSQPRDGDYTRTDSVDAGPGGGKLSVPAPFGMMLDASTMPIPRGEPEP